MPTTTPRPNGAATPEAVRRLDLEDHLTRLADLLHLVALAGEGVPPPHGPAIIRGTQIALDEVDEIRRVVVGE